MTASSTKVEVTCYENHANDSRITREGQVTQTLNSRMGTGGGQPPDSAMGKKTEITCYENHAQDSRVKTITGGGVRHPRIVQRELGWDQRQQPFGTVE